MSRRLVLATVAAVLSPAAAYGQGWVGEGRVTTLIDLSGISDSSEGGGALLVDANVQTSWEDVLQDGTQVRFVFGGRYQVDGRGGASSVDCTLLACRPAAASNIGSAASPLWVASLAGADTQIGVETASLTLTGAWGEGSVGHQAGAAVRLDARAPSVLEAAGAYSSQLDPFGLQIVRARNDPTGQALKLTYLSPRILGLRVGASFTPETGFKSADFDPHDRFAWSVGAPLDHVWEGAFSFSRSFPDAGVKLRAGVTLTEGRYVSGQGPETTYRSKGYGFEVERGASSFGVRALSSDLAGSKRYSAIEVGAAHDFGLWKIGFQTGRSSQDLSGWEGRTSLMALRRQISDELDVGVGLLSTNTAFALPGYADPSDSRNRRRGLLVELTVRK